MLLGHIKKKRQKTYNKHLFTIFMFKDKTRGKPDYYRVTTAPPPPSRSVPTQCPVFSLSPCGPLWWWLCVNGLHWEVPLQRQPGGSTFYCCTFWHFKIAYRTTYFPNVQAWHIILGYTNLILFFLLPWNRLFDTCYIYVSVVTVSA